MNDKGCVQEMDNCEYVRAGGRKRKRNEMGREITEMEEDKSSSGQSQADQLIQIQKIRLLQISASSRRNYRGPQLKFIKWIVSFRPHAVSDGMKQYLTSLNTEFISTKNVANFLGSEPDPKKSPLNFDAITADDISAFLLSIKKSNGSKPTTSWLNNIRYYYYLLLLLTIIIRSSISSLYRDFKKTMNDGTVKDVSSFFRGLSRENARFKY